MAEIPSYVRSDPSPTTKRNAPPNTATSPAMGFGSFWKILLGVLLLYLPLVTGCDEKKGLLTDYILRSTLKTQVTLDGNPTQGRVIISFRNTDGQFQTFLSVTTDESGNFETELEAGTWRVTAEVEGAECSVEEFQFNSETQTKTLPIPCFTLKGTLAGRATLDGDPLAGTTVSILAEDGSPFEDESGAVVAVTDGEGNYSLELPPGLYSPSVAVEGGFCPGPVFTQTSVEHLETSVRNLPCRTLPGTYGGTLSETSNTCSVPLQAPYAVEVRITPSASGGPLGFDMYVGDRGEESKVGLNCDQETYSCSGDSPVFSDGSGYSFQDSWEFDVEVDHSEDQTVTVVLNDGIVQATIFFPDEQGTCVRNYGFEGEEAEEGGGGG